MAPPTSVSATFVLVVWKTLTVVSRASRPMQAMSSLALFSTCAFCFVVCARLRRPSLPRFQHALVSAGPGWWALRNRPEKKESNKHERFATGTA